MSRFHRIAVYCASSTELAPAYTAAAKEMGHTLVEHNIGLVFGGGKIGLMGTIADTVLEHGGEVIGVIPKKLKALELAHLGCTELHVVDTMHERKQLMMDHADGFIAMPGGFGTMEELFEVVTWAQLNFHMKPVGILNVNGFYDDLLRFIQRAVNERFVREELRGLIVHDRDPAALVEKLRNAVVPDIRTWLPTPSIR